MAASKSARHDNLGEYEGGSSDSNLPIPDPTRLTTQLNEVRADVDRQVLALREFLMSQMENIAGVSAEKFQAINTRFIERDVRIKTGCTGKPDVLGCRSSRSEGSCR
jgi:hypothetical protein